MDRQRDAKHLSCRTQHAPPHTHAHLVCMLPANKQLQRTSVQPVHLLFVAKNRDYKNTQIGMNKAMWKFDHIQSEHCQVTFVEKSKHNSTLAQLAMCTVHSLIQQH